MGKTAQQARTAIPRVASLTVRSEQFEQLWAMSPGQRRQAAHDGQLSLGAMLRWAARYPDEVPTVNGECFYISVLLADNEDD